MLKLLLSSRGLGATDSRDMIYTHTGLASDRSELGKYVQIDYRLSREVLYEMVTQYLYNISEPGNIFLHLDNKDPATRRQNFAS
jgi:hypothetical protein